MSETPEVRLNYAGNSKKSQEAAKPAEEQKTEKNIVPLEGIVAQTRKKPMSRKIAETFTGDDAGSVADYVLLEVMVPAGKALLFDVISEAANRILFGSSGGRAGGRALNRASSHVAYNRVSEKGTRGAPATPTPRTISRHGRATHDIREIILETRGDAEVVLDKLRDALEEYEAVTLADLYELVNVTPEFIDQTWGWTSGELNQARVRPIGGGYLIDVPAPKLIK